jgi:enediyne core biosynthesis thioesterase
MREYEYRHRVCLEETNIVGNVYFTNYVSWQGRCREMFLHDHVPELARKLGSEFTMATTRVSCCYYQELAAFDEVVIRMSTGSLTPSRVSMLFRYYRILPDGKQVLVAEGEQEVVCIRRRGEEIEPVMIPEELQIAVCGFAERPAE